MKITSNYSPFIQKKIKKNNNINKSTSYSQNISPENESETTEISNIAPIVNNTLIAGNQALDYLEAKKIIDSLVDKLSELQKAMLDDSDENKEEILEEIEIIANFLSNNRCNDKSLQEIADELVNRCMVYIALQKE